MTIIIFTGINELLLSEENYDYTAVTILVKQLRQQDISLIPVASNTRAEVEALLDKIELDSPFIVEQGSGIFVPQGNRNFILTESDNLDKYHYYQLGCSYTEARAALKAVQEEISKILRGFGDMDESDIQKILNVSLSVAHNAKAREFSEYFLTPNRIPIEKLQQIALEYGFKISSEGKLSLFTGGHAEPTKAIKMLINSFQTSARTVKTIGLGSTIADLAWLGAVDVPIVIPGTLETKNGVSNGNWKIASKSNLDGWIDSIENILSNRII